MFDKILGFKCSPQRGKRLPNLRALYYVIFTSIALNLSAATLSVKSEISFRQKSAIWAAAAAPARKVSIHEHIPVYILQTYVGITGNIHLQKRFETLIPLFQMNFHIQAALVTYFCSAFYGRIMLCTQLEIYQFICFHSDQGTLSSIKLCVQLTASLSRTSKKPC